MIVKIWKSQIPITQKNKSKNVKYNCLLCLGLIFCLLSCTWVFSRSFGSFAKCSGSNCLEIFYPKQQFNARDINLDMISIQTFRLGWTPSCSYVRRKLCDLMYFIQASKDPLKNYKFYPSLKSLQCYPISTHTYKNERNGQWKEDDSSRSCIVCDITYQRMTHTLDISVWKWNWKWNLS